MGCIVCSDPDHEAAWAGNWASCPKHKQGSTGSTGWACPVCHKGNAPDVKGCVHCAARRTSNEISFTRGAAMTGDGGSAG